MRVAVLFNDYVRKLDLDGLGKLIRELQMRARLSDEPASILLERAKVEKALLKPSLRRGRRRRKKD